MPELPEVETIRRDLEARVVGRSFRSVQLLWSKAVRQPSPEEFARRLSGQKIESLDRRGKYLIFHLSGGDALILHLRMSGWLNHASPGSPPELYSRNIFLLDDGSQIQFCDRRKLGAIWLVADPAEVVGKLGPEPLAPNFTPKLLKERLKKRSAPIKAVLCDQEVLSGVGNMYADEALFLAKIHPLKKAGDLSFKEITKLHQSIRQVLQTALEKRGATVSDYKDAEGRPGTAQLAFAVAHQRGKICPVCSTPIQRIVVRARGTYFCPSCQKLDHL
jgi:formamidopyrimidine-DNA glycosylase